MSLHGQVLLLKASCRKSFLMYPSGCTWSKKLWPGTELASCHLSALCPGTGGSPAVAFGGRWPSPPRSPEVSEQFHRQASTGSVMQSTEEQDAAFEMRWWACRLEPTRRAASPGAAWSWVAGRLLSGGLSTHGSRDRRPRRGFHTAGV